MEDKKNQITQKEILCSEEGFWDDAERAKELMQDLEHLRSEVAQIDALKSSAQDLVELCDLAGSEQEWQEFLWFPRGVKGLKTGQGLAGGEGESFEKI